MQAAKASTTTQTAAIPFATMFKLPGIDSYLGGKAANGTYQRIITRSTA